MPSLEASVRDQISLYVEGYISADELNDALPDTWELDEVDEPGAIDLTMLVLGYLAEYQSGDRLELSLREALAEHASWRVEDSLSSVTTREGLEVQVRVGAGTPLQVVRA